VGQSWAICGAVRAWTAA